MNSFDPVHKKHEDEKPKNWWENRRFYTAGLLVVGLLFTSTTFPQNRRQGGSSHASRVTSLRQGAAGGAEGKGTDVVRSANVPAETPVVAINGVCDRLTKVKSAQVCRKVITSAKIEEAVSMTDPKSSPEERRQFAISFSKLVAASGEAELRHLEKDPEVVKEVQIRQEMVRMQVLANALYRQIEAQANDVPAADVQRFYIEHHDEFVRVSLRRIYIPKSLPPNADQPSSLEASKAIADDVRSRAAAGEDCDLLQQGVYKLLGTKAEIPSAKMGPLTRRELPIEEKRVFALSPGQVTDVIDELNGFVILKLESKEALPLDKARVKILPALQSERLGEQIQGITRSGMIQFNLKYLGLPSVPEFLPPPQLAEWARGSGVQMTAGPRVAPVRRSTRTRRSESTALPRLR